MQRRTRGLGAHHEQRRRHIADAVLAIVASRGLAAVSLNEVAAQAGVSPGRVQHYFPTKKQLIEAAFERANSLSSARIAEKADHTAPPRQLLTVVLTELIPYDVTTRTHLRVRQSFTALALADESIAHRLRAEYERFHHQIASLLSQDQTAGHIPGTIDPAEAAMSLVALTEGLAYYVLIGLYPADIARDRVLAAIAEIYR